MGRSYTRVALCVLGMVAGCSFSADFSGQRFRCEIDRDCPDGVQCGADGLCGGSLAPGDDGGASDGCVDGDLPEDFEGGPTCEPWGSTSSTGSTTIVEDGALTVTPGVDMMTTFGGCFTHGAVDFSRGVFAEVSGVVSSDAPEAYTILNLFNADEGTPFALSLTAHAGVITAYIDDVSRHEEPYDAVTMRWWRVRPAGGDILFETAADGILWAVLAAIPSPPMAEARINVGAGTNGPEAAPGTARFEGVNVCPPP